MKKGMYEQHDEINKLRAENERLKAQITELTKHREPPKNVKKNNANKTNKKTQKNKLIGNDYLNSRREYWHKEFENNPDFQNKENQKDCDSDVFLGIEMPKWAKWVGFGVLIVVIPIVLIYWLPGLIIPLGILGLISSGILKKLILFYFFLCLICTFIEKSYSLSVTQ